MNPSTVFTVQELVFEQNSVSIACIPRSSGVLIVLVAEAFNDKRTPHVNVENEEADTKQRMEGRCGRGTISARWKFAETRPLPLTLSCCNVPYIVG
jgi:hypothetical protein